MLEVLEMSPIVLGTSKRTSASVGCNKGINNCVSIEFGRRSSIKKGKDIH